MSHSHEIRGGERAEHPPRPTWRSTPPGSNFGFFQFGPAVPPAPQCSGTTTRLWNFRLLYWLKNTIPCTFLTYRPASDSDMDGKKLRAHQDRFMHKRALILRLLFSGIKRQIIFSAFSSSRWTQLHTVCCPVWWYTEYSIRSGRRRGPGSFSGQNLLIRGTWECDCVPLCAALCRSVPLVVLTRCTITGTPLCT